MNDEQAFLAAILEQPDDDARKLVYADWLEEQGDPRGEYLRLMMKVRQERVLTPEQRQRHNELSAAFADLAARVMVEGFVHRLRATLGPDNSPENHERRLEELQGQLAKLSRQIRQPIPRRLQELAATFDTNWLAVVSAPEIECCGKTCFLQENVTCFDFICDKTWADMKPTDDTHVRRCETCRNDVHFCDDLAAAREDFQYGWCFAVDLGIIRRDRDLFPPTSFQSTTREDDLKNYYEKDLDPVSQVRLDARKNARK